MPEPMSIDRFVSAVRVELQAKVSGLQSELLHLRQQTSNNERCDRIRGEIAGFQQAETVLIDVMRSRT